MPEELSDLSRQRDRFLQLQAAVDEMVPRGTLMSEEISDLLERRDRLLMQQVALDEHLLSETPEALSDALERQRVRLLWRQLALWARLSSVPTILARP
jgi:hypothetical protein